MADDVPVFTSGAAVSIDMDENETATGHTPSAAPDLTGDTVTYTIIGGADAALFELDSVTGALVFKSAPNYENPTGGDGNDSNTYEVEIRATDSSGLSSTQTVAVGMAILLSVRLDQQKPSASHRFRSGSRRRNESGLFPLQATWR